MIKFKKRSSKKGPVRSKKVSLDGIVFASGLEKHMYIKLKENNLFDKYEGEVFQLLPTFIFDQTSIERCGNGKGEYKDRGNKKMLGIKYTPDFTGRDYIIETKGRANESFPLRYKLMKYWMICNSDNRVLYKPQNQKECEETVRLILEKRNA
jgi:hypothetical protein